MAKNRFFGPGPNLQRWMGWQWAKECAWRFGWPYVELGAQQRADREFGEILAKNQGMVQLETSLWHRVDHREEHVWGQVRMAVGLGLEHGRALIIGKWKYWPEIGQIFWKIASISRNR